MVVDDEESVVEEDVPALCEVDGGVLALLLPAAVSADGDVVVLPPMPGVAAVDPVLGEVAVEPLLPVAASALGVAVEPEAVPDWAQASPKVPAMAAAMTVMLNFL